MYRLCVYLQISSKAHNISVEWVRARHEVPHDCLGVVQPRLSIIMPIQYMTMHRAHQKLNYAKELALH